MPEFIHNPNEHGRAVIDGHEALQTLRKTMVALSPLTKRRRFDHFAGVPGTLALGWAQLPQTQGQAFSVGVFIDDSHFSQIALADGKGRVFVGTDPDMDTHDMEPSLLFGKETELKIPARPRLARPAGKPGSLAGRLRALVTRASGKAGVGNRLLDAVQGGIVGRDAFGQMTWLASWLKHANRYTLEQLRMELPKSMRMDLEYRDAVSIAFFGAYLLPQLSGLLIGFGSGNIFRRLNREAPLGAIRRSVRDCEKARSNGLRVSGLEEYFSELMQQSGALDNTPGLEAVHGAEPLHLYTSSYSGSYFFSWDSSLEFAPALKALKIEGNLNRFAATSAWLERNARMGAMPIEDTVTRAQAAQIDLALLDDPALGAFKNDDSQLASMNTADPHGDMPNVGELNGDDGVRPVMHMITVARETSSSIAEGSPDPVNGSANGEGSEWVYRQSMSTLLSRLRLPYRYDVEFRSNLREGNVSIAFTTAGVSMMPSQRYDCGSHTWTALGEGERAAMSANYNLRVGLMMAALGFGADPNITQVSLHIDSFGLEEIVAEQDSAISQLMSQALSAFEHMRISDIHFGPSKADPKDGDVHGDPSRPGAAADESELRQRGEAPSSSPQGETEDDDEQREPQHDPQHGRQGGRDPKTSVDRQFEDLMKGVDFPDIDIDEMTFASSDGGNRTQGDDAQKDDAQHGDTRPDQDDRDDPHGFSGDPIEALRRNPSVRNMVTVTFEREAFLARLQNDGLRHPVETYRQFNAAMDVDGQGGLRPVNAKFNLRDARFSPAGAQEEPELADMPFDDAVAHVLGATNAVGLSIQRADLLQRAVDDFHGIASADSLPSVAKAQQAMAIVEELGDPELDALAPQVGSALIDSTDTPDFNFTLSADLDRDRLKARDLLFSGQVDQGIASLQAQSGRLDAMFASRSGVPRYFNSYAERVVYNRLFATPGERMVLIPDNLFYAHMELADVLAQIKGAQASLPQLSAMVSYAPTYPLSHMKLAVQLARKEDWDSARAACLNALRVALDRNDAAFAYYRFAYAEWMRDELDVAAAAYVMSSAIAPGQIGSLDAELHELLARAQSQCIIVPRDTEQAQQLLTEHGLPVWPNTEAAAIVRDAARVCVDNGMFVPARTLSVAVARMNEADNNGIDMAQAQFLRSLNT
ncbi:tetratricopeptide repeat protein [Bifidobacterium sp.]|jgi:hypothetical protein|uniref:tetratricopeptide repeat protein n=1 Tax=Bifidobacterium sp. TaxID=41200 RepID=UPI0025BA2B6E|nr:tetratricopeptide repeat protein [Bifidobacterium sp.]MCH4208630.1 tetratricopeptide repeat protein [Bifidobacterium sp.]MCI1224397.1 tetratricopeptide repeat protein [Bifidobacterium sp.]